MTWTLYTDWLPDYSHPNTGKEEVMRQQQMQHVLQGMSLSHLSADELGHRNAITIQLTYAHI